MEMTTARVCDRDRLRYERISALAFAGMGALFWAVAAFGGEYFYRGATFIESIGGALVPLLLAIAALAIGWFYERIAAIALAFGAAAIVVWGIVAAWNLGAWMGMLAIVVLPMLISATLFWFAARMEDVCRNAEEDSAGLA